MKNSMGEKGFIKTLFTLLIFGAIVVLLIVFVQPYYRSYTLGSLTRDYLKSHVGDSADLDGIKKSIMKDAADLGIKLNENDISVAMVQRLVKVKVTWKDTVDLWGYYQKTFDFVMEEEY